MAYSKRRLFRRHSAKKRLSKRKTYRKRRTRRQRGRGVGFSAPVDQSDSYDSQPDMIRFAINDNPELKQMIDEIPRPPDSYSGPARSAEEQERDRLKMRDYRQRKNDLLLSWFKTQKQLGNNRSDYNQAIKYLENNTI